MSAPACPLCRIAQAETVYWRDASCRVIDGGDADYPGYCRVVWNAHVREMTDLSVDRRQRLLAVVFAVEETLRALLAPDKINLASLGNQVPHLHWHVVPRFADDPHFPDSIWAARKREGRRRALGAERFARDPARRLARDGV